MRAEFQGCTVLAVAHRLHTIIDADSVLVMDAGRAAEFGPPAELLNRPGGNFAGGNVWVYLGGRVFGSLAWLLSKGGRHVCRWECVVARVGTHAPLPPLQTWCGRPWRPRSLSVYVGLFRVSSPEEFPSFPADMVRETGEATERLLRQLAAGEAQAQGSWDAAAQHALERLLSAPREAGAGLLPGECAYRWG